MPELKRKPQGRFDAGIPGNTNFAGDCGEPDFDCDYDEDESEETEGNAEGVGEEEEYGKA